jgi:hypothetical protein
MTWRKSLVSSHIQHHAGDLERSGLDRAEAERRARIEFGGQGRYREEVRESFGGNFIETVVKDVRFSLRVLRKSPGFTIVAVLTLALAISANAVVFGLLNALIPRPMNLPQVQSLYGIDRVGADAPTLVVSRLSRPARSKPQLRWSGGISNHGGWARYGRKSIPRLPL